MAYEYGMGTFFSPEGDTLSTDQYTVLWKLQDGSWRLHRDAIVGPTQ